MISVDSILERRELNDFDENFELIKEVSGIIDTDSARKILIHILEIWNEVNENAKEMWLDLVERAGFYPYYISRLGDISNDNISFKTQIRTAFYKSSYLEDIYFHEQQKEIEFALSRGESIAVSAPTSFGKSLLIEEIVARKQYKNILIIQPTLALIDETRRKMQKYKDFYNLVINTKQNLSDNNIFILTAERVLEFPNLPMVDFFIIDEFYKISNRRNDSRIDALNVALLKVMAMGTQSLFLTPTVDSLSEKFREKYSISFYKTDYSLVNTKIIEVRNSNQNFYKSTGKKQKLFQLLEVQTEPSIVYVKSPKEAYKLANEYYHYLEERGKLETVDTDLDVFDWIDENISPDWELKMLLSHKIGAHNGSLPRHIVTSEIELFNNKIIKVMFATTSLIEGVNTSAKSIFIFSQYKGHRTEIDFFDFANIRGRAGRMNQYYTGNVYLFFDEPSKEDFIIDVPSIDQDEVSDEILINIPNEDLEDRERKEDLLNGLDEELIKIISFNLISTKGQIELYRFIEENREVLTDLIWTARPNYEQLKKVLSLGYRFLHNNHNEKFINGQTAMALKIAYSSTLKQIIREQREYYESIGRKEPLKEAINDVLEFQRREAGFNIPKILSVVDSIQKYVFNKYGITPGDYTVFASVLESEQVQENLQFLIDYGVPSSALKKIKNIPLEWSNIEVVRYLKEKLEGFGSLLLPYEKRLLERVIR